MKFENFAIGALIAYFAAALAVAIGWVGNLIHAFYTVSATDLVLTLAGVFVPPLGAIKFYFF